MKACHTVIVVWWQCYTRKTKHQTKHMIFKLVQHVTYWRLCCMHTVSIEVWSSIHIPSGSIDTTVVVRVFLWVKQQNIINITSYQWTFQHTSGPSHSTTLTYMWTTVLAFHFTAHQFCKAPSSMGPSAQLRQQPENQFGGNLDPAPNPSGSGWASTFHHTPLSFNFRSIVIWQKSVT